MTITSCVRVGYEVNCNLANIRSFLTNQKAKNTISEGENLLKINIQY